MSKSKSKAWRRYRDLPAVPRELATLALMLLLALTMLPLAIWVAGRIFLGEYQRDPHGGIGGPAALLSDYVGGIASGSPGHWLAFLGPYLLLLAFRVSRILASKR